jgi:transcriptional regulator with XRE-family HTH domain
MEVMKMEKRQKPPLAKWETEFLTVLKKEGSSDAKEIYSELERLLEETSHTSEIEEKEAEQTKKEHADQVKNLEKRIEYTNEQAELTKVQPSIRELEKKIKEQSELLNENPKSIDKKQLKALEKQLQELKKQIEPSETIVGGLQRKLRTVTNRIERSVFSGFGSIIKNRREELRLSLKQIEAETGISPSYINRIEKGQRKAPSYRIIEQLAKALDLPVSKLMHVAEVQVQEDVPSIEELLLTSQFKVNGKRASKQSKEKMVEFVKRLTQATWESDKKYEEALKLMGFFDYFKETFGTNKK